MCQSASTLVFGKKSSRYENPWQFQRPQRAFVGACLLAHRAFSAVVVEGRAVLLGGGPRLGTRFAIS